MIGIQRSSSQSSPFQSLSATIEPLKDSGLPHDAAPGPPFELGKGDDETLDHSQFPEWPKAWPLPTPNNGLHPIESEAVNFEDSQHNEHLRARDDWGNLGKNHQTIDKWDD